jgi:serine/threonine protein kinase/tetratricopeptide (TPR) repeat protein
MSTDPRDAVPPGDGEVTRESVSSSQPGGQVGPYRLLQRIGEGGMGEVWLAEQTRPVRRQVALKIIKAGMDSAQVVARFEAERQALALMDHPAIAKVFDAGTTPQGRPYFAMEYVRGEPITAYCDRHRLTTPERLDLFIHVCEGVQHAHQKGIIHRDLKPSNVLVTIQDDHPVPKIIDFGVAKATAQHLTERTLYTELGVMIGTPEYMSPEQAEMGGLDIDTRTNVYALGVMLYELLTGALPFEHVELRRVSLLEIQLAIREKEPPRPSTRVTQLGLASTEAAHRRQTEPARLASDLRGDLDWITMKALEKDRTRRYDTVMGLANDVRRHLQNEPVLASPPSTTYRVKKFVRRHRFGVAAAATVVVLLVAFAATMALQAHRIARERDRANREAETAKQVSSFLVGLFELSKPSEAAANSVTAREILDKGAQRIRGELRDQPAIRATVVSTLGNVYRSLGLYAKARALDEEALALRRQVFGPRSLEVASSLVAVGRSLSSEGQYEEAERMFRTALETRRSLLGAEDPVIGDTLRGLASVVQRQGHHSEAETLVRQALAIHRRVLPPPSEAVASDLGSLGGILFDRANYAGAEQAFAEAVEIDRQIKGAQHPDTVMQLDNLASARVLQGKYAEGERAYRENLDALRQRLGADHPDLGLSFSNLGAVLYFEGKYPEAEAAYREAVARHRQGLGARHPEVALDLTNLGQALDAQRKYTEAETVIREALSIQREALGGDHPDLVPMLCFLSTTMRHAGKFHEAERLAREALTISRSRLGQDHPRTKEAEGHLGLALAAQREWAAAEPLLLSYAAALETKTGAEGNLSAVVGDIIGMYDAWGKRDKAAEWRKKLADATAKKKP